MTEPPESPATLPGNLSRIAVHHGEKRLDLSVPGALPLVEVLPAITRHLGALDSARAHGGYALVRPDGTTLAAELTLDAQGVSDGDTFTLWLGAEVEPAKVYDDIVEAVGDAAARHSAPWSPTDAAATAQGAAVALLTTAAALLALGPPSATAAALAGAGVAAAASGGAVVTRMGMVKGGAAITLTACLYAAVLGKMLAELLAPTWQWPATYAGLALGGVLGAVVAPRARAAMVTPITAGLALGGATLALATTDMSEPGVFALTAAVAGTVTNAIPWLALATSRIKAVTPFTTSEILDEQPPIDPVEVQHRYSQGQRVGLALRCGAMLVAVCCLPGLLQGGGTALAEALALFVGLMLSSRQAYSRLEVGLVGCAGIMGLGLTALLATQAHPEWRGWLAAVMAAAAAITAGITILGRVKGTGLGRMADALDLVALVSLLPLAIIVAGLA